MKLRAAARNSPLSKAQVEEVMRELGKFYQDFSLDFHGVVTGGDIDKKTSLRTLGKTDFFTREVDEMVLSGKCHIAIHSAKDLPETIPRGLHCIALTKGVDPSDSLVFREQDSLFSLPKNAKIATSSLRREETVKALRQDLEFVDIRGTIDERLAKLFSKEVEGVVIAEAALIRLGYTHLNRIRLPGETALFQGQLAIIAKENDWELAQIFSKISTQKRVLFMGPEYPRFLPIDVRPIHCPLMRIVPRSFQEQDIRRTLQNLKEYTHLIFTSKHTVRIFFEVLAFYGVQKSDAIFIAVGRSTAEELNNFGITAKIIAGEETAEGILKAIRNEPKDSFYFWPHSARARTVITDYFKENALSFEECVFYDVEFIQPKNFPSFTEIDEICFTSPSTVDSFLEFFTVFPKNIPLQSWGPITKHYLLDKIQGNRVFSQE